ncbi:MAG: Gfo/Idh/MocA family oxidoreductase [Bacteroidales bacterium]|nr:Gfo/Idh/MocA family oxidoreductase [Bacteroidales bacterium]
MSKISRRDFFGCTAALGGSALLASTPLLSSCTGSKTPKVMPLRSPEEYYLPSLDDKADDGRELKAGLIGCGGRGTGAAANMLQAAAGVKFTAFGDVFEDRIEEAISNLTEWGYDVSGVQKFVGFDAYKKVIDSGVDVVILTTPPLFRPYHFQYAVSKGVHAFLEKPVAVDAKGCRTIIAAAKQAQAKKLAVVTGTQRHHERSYVEAFKLIQDGMIGEITGGNVYWNQGMLWYREREKGWSDMEWAIRDWVNWKFLSGDHIVEQHVHNIDVFMWMTGSHPIKATGFGSRQRRVTGDQYDNFSIDFEFENGVHLHSMSRQIDGCANNVSEYVRGTKGYWNTIDDTIRNNKGEVLWQFDRSAEQAAHKQTDPYVLEHVDLINHIRKGEMLDQATETAMSTLAGVMGREAAYTGKTILWDEIMASDMDYLPADMDALSLGRLDAVQKPVIPVPGEARK